MILPRKRYVDIRIDSRPAMRSRSHMLGPSIQQRVQILRGLECLS